MALPYLDALATYRDEVRALARDKKGRGLLQRYFLQYIFIFQYAIDHKEFLRLSDQLRDQVLPALGVLLEDREGGSKPMLKLASPEEIEGIHSGEYIEIHMGIYVSTFPTNSRTRTQTVGRNGKTSKEIGEPAVDGRATSGASRAWAPTSFYDVSTERGVWSMG